MNNKFYFKNHKLFYQWLMECGVKLNFDKTVRCSRYSYYIGDEFFFNGKFVDMVDSLNKHLPRSGQIDKEKSSIKGMLSYSIVLREEDFAAIQEIVASHPMIDIPVEDVPEKKQRTNSRKKS